MKTKLTILSLSPICLLTFIMNFKFDCLISDGQTPTVCEFILNNIFTIIILFICLLWCLISVFLLCYFKFFGSFGENGGFTINTVHEDKEAGINFFLTFILPLLIGDLNEWQNAVGFVLIFIIIFILLMKTDLFYANPILTICGYHVYKVIFNNNFNIRGECVAVTTKRITEKNTIEYKNITDEVIFIKIIERKDKKNAAK